MNDLVPRVSSLVSRWFSFPARYALRRSSGQASRATRYATGAALVLVLAASACHSDAAGPRAVAEHFLDQHYVRIDLEAAKPFCTGLALQKLTNEQHLIQGQQIDESTRKPTVHYRLIETKDDAEHPTFVFQGTIDVEDAGQFTRKWLLAMRRDGNDWKVANFEEFD